MYYYKKNIGDYYKKTGRLSMLEHGAYTLLIDACYDRERFPTLEEALDWSWARSEQEIEAVKFVLSKFFTLVGEHYIQHRIKEELEAYHAMSEKNAEIAKNREEKRRQRKQSVNESCSSGEPQKHEAPPNQEPLTKNQEPLTNKPINNISESDKTTRFMFNKELIDLGCDKELVIEYMAHRKAKKASNGKIAFDGLIREQQKSGLDLSSVLRICIERGWRGFEASWLKNQNNSYQTAAQRTAQEHDKWRMAEQQAFGEKDVTPVNQVLIGGSRNV